MDDRTLLELAAKAAGIDLHIDTVSGYRNGAEADTWNPLRDDGDALQLAVKLGMGILYETQTALGGRFIEVSYDFDDDEETCKVACELLGDDPYAATRRAIVRAAAAIGDGDGR